VLLLYWSAIIDTVMVLQNWESESSSHWPNNNTLDFVSCRLGFERVGRNGGTNFFSLLPEFGVLLLSSMTDFLWVGWGSRDQHDCDWT
jgi:hypothetical protein